MQARFKMEYRLFTIVRYDYRDYNKRDYIKIKIKIKAGQHRTQATGRRRTQDQPVLGDYSENQRVQCLRIWIGQPRVLWAHLLARSEFNGLRGDLRSDIIRSQNFL